MLFQDNEKICLYVYFILRIYMDRPMYKRLILKDHQVSQKLVASFQTSFLTSFDKGLLLYNLLYMDLISLVTLVVHTVVTLVVHIVVHIKVQLCIEN